MSSAGASAGATAAIIAAKKKREQERREEQELTKYNENDLQGWEFKIVRNYTGRFKNYEKVQQLVQEEAQNGWEMIEKFDNYRIRFKRRTDRRSMDPHAKIDPYRTQVGISSGQLGLTITGSILLGIGLIFGIIFLVRGFV